MRLLTTAFLIFGAVASADTISLRNGQVVQGTFLGGTSRQIRVDVNGNIETFDIGQVQSVSFVDPTYQAPPPPPPPPQASIYPDERDRGRGGFASAPPPSGPGYGRPMGVTIPVDTPITIRMIDAVNSETARLGQTFRASIDEPVVVDG
ncbi:MAG TPA: hypothetical protein VHB50_10700, partial [Bryobacteraceae bacterium]|nr:hypothetical protein [Bryobacteraceae bacterium]